MKDLNKDLMDELFRLVYDSKLSKESIASKLGVSTRTLYRWLAGDTKVPAMAIKLARKLRL